MDYVSSNGCDAYNNYKDINGTFAKSCGYTKTTSIITNGSINTCVQHIAVLDAEKASDKVIQDPHSFQYIKQDEDSLCLSIKPPLIESHGHFDSCKGYVSHTGNFQDRVTEHLNTDQPNLICNKEELGKRLKDKKWTLHEEEVEVIEEMTIDETEETFFVDEE